MRTAMAACSAAHSARCASTAARTAALASAKATQNAPSSMRKVLPPCRVIASRSNASWRAATAALRASAPAAPSSKAVRRKVIVRMGGTIARAIRESSATWPTKR